MLKKTGLLFILISFLVLFLYGCSTTTQPDITAITVTSTPTPTPTPKPGKLISAVLSDQNGNGVGDSGDYIILSFDKPLDPNSISIFIKNDFEFVDIFNTKILVTGYIEQIGIGYQQLKAVIVTGSATLESGKTFIRPKCCALKDQDKQCIVSKWVTIF